MFFHYSKLELGTGYIYQETHSLAGSIIMHNVADGLETTIEYLLYLVGNEKFNR
jgi:hypothetical protein